MKLFESWENREVTLWKKWIFRGLLGWAFLLLATKSLGLLWMLVNAVVHWMPRASLAWVPGINLVWFFILVVAMGRVLSSEMSESLKGSICAHFKRCPALARWCACFSCVASSIKVHKVVVPLSQGRGYKIGTLIALFDKDSQQWGQVVFDGEGLWTQKTSYFYLIEDLVEFDAFKASSAFSSENQCYLNEIKEVL